MLNGALRAWWIAAVLWVLPAGAQAMTFSLARLQGNGACGAQCPLVIFANGQITADSPEQFALFLKNTPGISKVRSAVMLNSPGGQVVGALKLGLIWKELNITTLVAEPVTDADGNATAIRPARCYSACAYALMGARTRVVPEGSQVGIHRMHSFSYQRDPAENRFERNTIFAPSDQVEVLRRYSRLVGGDPRVVDLAEAVAPTSIRVLTQAEMKALHVTTADLTANRTRKSRRN